MSSGPGSWVFPDLEGCPESSSPPPKSLQESIPTRFTWLSHLSHPLSCQGCLLLSQQDLPLHGCSPPQLREGEDKLALARAGKTG